MKVIKEGTAHLINIICDSCESELQYEPKDIFCEKDIYLDREEHFSYIKCPVCNKTITVDIQIIQYETQKKSRWWHRFVDDSDWPPV